MFGGKHDYISSSRVSRGKTYELVIRDQKTRPERASRGLEKCHTPYVYRQLVRQSLPIDEEIPSCDNRSREIIRLCGLRLPVVSLPESEKPPRAVRHEFPLKGPEERVNI